jgi:HSP20 family protein
MEVNEMANVVRWSPSTLRRNWYNDIDQMMSDMMRFGVRPYQEQMSWDLALDVSEDDDAFKIKASVPGVNPENIDITLEDNTLTIKGTTEDEQTVDEENYHLRERRYGQFMRSVRLPARVANDDVEATCENGVLTIRVPKAEETKARRIAVKGSPNGEKVIEAEAG